MKDRSKFSDSTFRGRLTAATRPAELREIVGVDAITKHTFLLNLDGMGKLGTKPSIAGSVTLLQRRPYFASNHPMTFSSIKGWELDQARQPLCTAQLPQALG